MAVAPDPLLAKTAHAARPIARTEAILDADGIRGRDAPALGEDTLALSTVVAMTTPFAK
jgi:hypothetical protein